MGVDVVRRTRIIKGLIITIILAVAAVLIYKNYVAAEDGLSVMMSNPGTVNQGESFSIEISFAGDIPEFDQSATISYDSEKLSCSEGSDGTATFFISGSGKTLSFNAIESGNASISISFPNGITGQSGNAYSDANVTGTKSVSVSVEESEQPDPPVEEYPVITPSVLSLTPSNNEGVLECSMDVEWSSGNESLISVVPEGARKARVILLGESGGPVTVTATTLDGSKTAQALVGIGQDDNPYIPLPDEPDTPEDINPDDYPDIPVQPGAPVVSPSGNQSLVVGNTLQLTVDQANVTWQSSDVGVAMVTGSGLIQAISKGSAMITVKNTNGDSTSFFVIVNEESSNNSTNNGGGNTNERNNQSTSNTTTKNTTIENTTTKSGKENPTADDPVPETGENTMEMVVLIAIVTLIVAAVIFKKKSRKSR